MKKKSKRRNLETPERGEPEQLADDAAVSARFAEPEGVGYFPVAEAAAGTTEPDDGIKCPKCNCRHCPKTEKGGRAVLYARDKPGHIMRRRRCRYCGHEFTTRERVDGD